MKYLFLLGFCAVIFLLCFLIDKLIQKLFPKHKLEKSKTVVRPPRKSAVFGVLLLVFPLMALLFWMPEEGDTLLTICCVGAMLMGAFLLVTYFSVSIYYGEDGFLYKTLRGGKKEYRYKDIRDQSLQLHAKPQSLFEACVFPMVRGKRHRPGFDRK